jgi:myosin heavy subunit
MASRPALPSRPPMPPRPSSTMASEAASPAAAGPPPQPSRPGGGAKPPPQPARPTPPPAQPAQPPRPAPVPAPVPAPAPAPAHAPAPAPALLPPSTSVPTAREKEATKEKSRPAAFVPPTVKRVADDGWSERYTMDGAPYYYNMKTLAVSWNCPESLKDSEELVHEGGNWIWVADAQDAWVPAREMDGGMYLTNNGNRVKVTEKDPKWPIMMSSLRHLEEDLVMIDDMNEGLIIHNLRERFREDKIYTAIGTILVSVNPFKRLPLYMPSIMEMYYKSGGNKRLPPHPFAIADHSYKKMREFKKHQSILISGESGAGKTEATKHCLAFFAEVAGSESGVAEKIIEANPILEAFGNAKTGRNNNSSRFGKFMEIHFDKLGQIVGCRTENYLLEKSRVVFQTEGERTYHIFYMLCVGALQEHLGLDRDMNTYRYLSRSGCLEVDGMDDAKEFDEVLHAMNCLGFSDAEQKFVFEVTAAVLLLGNLTFTANAKGDAVISNPQVLAQISKFLAADNTEFLESIISRWFVIRGQDPTKIPFKPNEAVNAADACAKAVYGKLFDWIVQRVNSAMVIPKGTINFIGVLDIFGFEIFETNSFEQLCINFANEKLQQHFNEYTFKLEETVYQTEQIKFLHIEFIDNQPILDMIEKKPKGLLVQLDEEIVMPKGNDETWFNKISRDFEKTPYFQKVVKKKGHFIVNHYAGIVPYDSDGFLEKNRDSLWPDILKCLSESKNKELSNLFSGGEKGRVSLGGQFRGQLTNLMEKLRSTEPSYIRCVKPNSVKQPDIFDSVMSLQQLRYAGVFEAIKIRQQGYPFRLTHPEFLKRYKCLSLKEEGGWLY